jgi:rubredoxin
LAVFTDLTGQLRRTRLHLASAISTKRPEPDGGPIAGDCPRQKKPENSRKQAMKKWQCVVCGLIYNEADGWPDDGIAPGTLWQDVPEDWLCPDCGVGKMDFEMIEIA